MANDSSPERARTAPASQESSPRTEATRALRQETTGSLRTCVLCAQGLRRRGLASQWITLGRETGDRNPGRSGSYGVAVVRRRTPSYT